MLLNSPPHRGLILTDHIRNNRASANVPGEEKPHLIVALVAQMLAEPNHGGIADTAVVGKLGHVGVHSQSWIGQYEIRYLFFRLKAYVIHGGNGFQHGLFSVLYRHFRFPLMTC